MGGGADIQFGELGRVGQGFELMLRIIPLRSGWVAIELRVEREQRVGTGFETGGFGFYGVPALRISAKLIAC
jgi:hypothetical protein